MEWTGGYKQFTLTSKKCLVTYWQAVSSIQQAFTKNSFNAYHCTIYPKPMHIKRTQCTLRKLQVLTIFQDSLPSNPSKFQETLFFSSPERVVVKALKPMRRPKDHRHGRHIVFASRRMDHRARNLRRRGEELSEDRTLPLVVIEPLLAPTPFRRFRQIPDLIDGNRNLARRLSNPKEQRDYNK